MSIAQQKKSRRSMILLVGIFVIPVVLAKLALSFQWFDYGVTNKGQLVADELTLEKLGLAESLPNKNWHILYTNIEPCEQQCEQVIQSILNTYTALGREMPRVTPVLIAPPLLSDDIKAQHKAMQWLTLSSKIKNQIHTSQVLIADPLGNIVLSHPLPKTNEALPFFGKEILADMKKLLKYSRIG